MFLYQPTSGYRYNSDSIFLYNFIAKLRPKGKLLDVGCGVGIISLLLSRDFNIDTTIIDKQESMLKYAMKNFYLNGLEVESHLLDFLSYKSSDKYDFIISNPPFYSPSVIQSSQDHLNIARYSHHLPIDKFFNNVKKLLAPKGYFVFCYDAKQIDTLLYQMKISNLNPEKIQFIHSKIDNHSKLVMIMARNSSKSMTTILPPFVVLDEEGNYMPDATEAFSKSDTYSIKGDF